ncbi:hypothetical protein RJ639_003253 [Escallonia herrerae]|uniref:Uncharacterized protein n=1 Tax=Escallonia herrerae TaxID=1293975 RepID=A0AA89AYF4_9ASTE|nr:hypothetical protein RJ639_003253 [Escallonia herrerae]
MVFNSSPSLSGLGLTNSIKSEEEEDDSTMGGGMSLSPGGNFDLPSPETPSMTVWVSRRPYKPSASSAGVGALALKPEFAGDNTLALIADDIITYIQLCANSALQTVGNYSMRKDYIAKIRDHVDTLTEAIRDSTTDIESLAKDAATYKNSMFDYIKIKKKYGTTKCVGQLPSLRQPFLLRIQSEETTFTKRCNLALFTHRRQWRKQRLNPLIVYILNCEPLLEPGDNASENEKKEWQRRNDDEVMCHGHILNALSDRLYNFYKSFDLAKEIWKALEYKYKVQEEDFRGESSKSDLVSNSRTEPNFDVDNSVVPAEEPRRSQRHKKGKDLSKDFISPDSIVFLVEGSREIVLNLTPIILNVDSDPMTYTEAVTSRDAAFWKEAINNEMDSIMSNGTWTLVDLPPGHHLNREVSLHLNEEAGMKISAVVFFFSMKRQPFLLRIQSEEATFTKRCNLALFTHRRQWRKQWLNPL